ncbi:MAG: hypothetical protein HFJ41_06455 [Clostridia bacterium]|nr:hypothetical protein [Clostridia bacterium]
MARSFSSHDDEVVQEFDALNAMLNTQAVAYYKDKAKAYGDKAREAYELYNTANAHYRQMVALGLPTDTAVDMVQRALNVYHYYEHMCSEFTAKAHLVMQVC